MTGGGTSAQAASVQGSTKGTSGIVWDTVWPESKKTVINHDGRWEDFWIGTMFGPTTENSGALWHEYVDNSGHRVGPVSLGGEIYDSFCVQRNVDRDYQLEVFVKARGGDVNHIRQNASSPGGWTGWLNDLGGTIHKYTGVFCTKRADGALGVLVQGDDDLLHTKWQLSPGSHSWSPNWSFP
jgi:hypothetical protein